MINMNSIVGEQDILFITFDTLRFDVAQREIETDGTPNLKKLIPGGRWEKRHTPGNFTYSAHHAFFAGFLPTPASPGPHERLFAASFSGSETSGPNTFVFEDVDIVTALDKAGYHTACIGGVGFFNKVPPLGDRFTQLFHESHWHRSFGVTDRDSTKHQIKCAIDTIQRVKTNKKRKLFLFINISALHQPNLHYLEGATEDTVETHAAALRYIDSKLPPLINTFQQHGNPFMILCSDHGTAYGEDGYYGHRVGHDTVWTVPFAAFSMEQAFS